MRTLPHTAAGRNAVCTQPEWDAMELARPAGLEALTADAMMSVALVEPSREGRLAWQERTIDFARAA